MLQLQSMGLQRVGHNLATEQQHKGGGGPEMAAGIPSATLTSGYTSLKGDGASL